jgi:ubiquinone/menaquinone biosynthesis C-methylase UbiE
MSIANLNKNVFEDTKVAATYARDSGLHLPEQALFQKYASIIDGKSILDIGCGGGRTTEYLLPIAGRYIGIDYSSAMVNKCKTRFPQAKIEVCDVRNMGCFSSNQFDFILFSFNGIDYMDHKDRIQAIREIHRVLRVDGYFMFSTHNKEIASKISNPTLSLSLNLKKSIHNVYDYLTFRKNRNINIRKQLFFDDYAIINDSAHNYASLTYYISPSFQLTQLRENGFQVIDQASLDGQLKGGSSSDDKSTWVHYLCQKTLKASGKQ